MVMPVAGSALPGGQPRPLAGFFRCAQLPPSAGAEATAPFVWAGGAVMVDVDEAVELVEAMDEAEFCR